jgi:hypothetical protein
MRYGLQTVSSNRDYPYGDITLTPDGEMFLIYAGLIPKVEIENQ